MTFRGRIMLWVALGSAVGGCLRIAVSQLFLALGALSLPWPTLTVNVLGSLLMGFLAARLPVSREGGPSAAHAFLLPGLCGGFTTFSIFSLETLALVQDGRGTTAAIYVCLTALLGIASAGLGYRLATPVRQAVSNR